MLTSKSAHVEVVEILLSTYNADANLPAGRVDLQQGIRSVHVLEVALQHQRDICRSLLKILLQHGASLLDKSTGSISKSVLHLAIMRNRDALDVFAEYDSSNFIHAITKVVWIESIQCETPLTGAIRSGSEDTALELLSYGASPQVTFDSSLDVQVDFLLPGKTAIEVAKEHFWQPILVAAQYEMPKVVVDLLDRGADPNATLTAHQADKMFEHRDCRSVLDLVRAKLNELRNWHKKDEQINYDIKGTLEEIKQLSGKENAIIKLIRGYENAEARLVTLQAQVTDELSLQELSNPLQLRPQKEIQLGIPRFKETSRQNSQISDAGSHEIDVRKLKTLEEGHSAL
jgi:hypothetical protein